MDTTLANLKLENDLLRAQMNALREAAAPSAWMRLHMEGTAPGDLVLCAQPEYPGVLRALLPPVQSCLFLCEDGYLPDWIAADVRVAAVPDSSCARSLAARTPSAIVLQTRCQDVLEEAVERSVDCVYLGDVLRTLTAADARRMVFEACRIARVWVVARCRQAPAEGNEDHPGILRYEESGLAVDPVFQRSIGVAPRDARGAILEFTAIMRAAAPANEPSVYLVSEARPGGGIRPEDLVFCDMDLAGSLRAETRYVFPVPMRLLRESLSLPAPLLRRTLLNFAYLEYYMRIFRTVAIGPDAEFVAAEMRHRAAAAGASAAGGAGSET